MLALANELDLAVKLVGVGEQYEDLQDFDARASQLPCLEKHKSKIAAVKRKHLTRLLSLSILK